MAKSNANSSILEPFDASSAHLGEVVRIYLEAFDGDEDGIRAFIVRHATTLPDAWVLVDLAVRRAYRNRGIGAALLDTLLASQPCPRALLSTEVANAGAQRLYGRTGWRYPHPSFVFTPGQPPFVVIVMGREIASWWLKGGLRRNW